MSDLRPAQLPASGHVHFVGVCGIGMAGLAVLARGRGMRVTGCDVDCSGLGPWLRARGIDVTQGHGAAHTATGVDVVVRSSAVSRASDEIAAAVAAGIPVLMRGQVLASLLDGRTSVAVAGTHGKTTTTGFVTQVLRACGVDPAFCIGGDVPCLGGPAAPGDGRTIVVEADESDGTAALYAPTIAVVTNIEPDHLENFGTMESLVECFRRFAVNARTKVYCADDPRAAGLCGPMQGSVSFGLSAGAVVTARDVELGQDSSRFTLVSRGTGLGAVTLPVPGRHNILNALAAAAVSFDMGLDAARVIRALSAVELPRRRFDVIVRTEAVRVVSDYAHHPTEIRALIDAAARQRQRRLLAVFQPHRYSRTLALGEELASAFDGVDELVLTPVYAASERPLQGGTIWDLYARFTRRGECDAGRKGSRPAVAVARSLEAAWAHYRRILRQGDMLLVVGAGSVEKIAAWAKDDMRGPLPGRTDLAGEIESLRLESTEVRADEPLGGKTTLGLGGPADVWAEVGSVRNLSALARLARERGVRLTVIGGGSNILVSDLGVRGIVVRLRGSAFSGLREEGETVVAGAGVPLGRLLSWLQEKGLSGMEFLEGIPATVGGAAATNAGAWGSAFGDRFAWARVVDEAGDERIVSDAKFGYRSGIRCGTVVEVAMKAGRDEPQAIGARRTEFARRRAWMKGLRCAGSVFRNPEGDAAGRLLDAAGLKGVRVGGAVISDLHANIIVAGDGATATDVMALMEIARAQAAAKFGIELQNEIELLE